MMYKKVRAKQEHEEKRWDIDEVKALRNECGSKQIFTQDDACILPCVYGWIYDQNLLF